MKEIWKTINGFTDYKVSNYGKVKSLKYKKEKILKLSISSCKYYFVGLWKNGVRINCKIHRLVTTAFIPNPENKPQVNHKDGNKQNNCVNNLEWVTCSENHLHAYKSKIRKTNNGNNSPYHKLREKEVLSIHGLYLDELTQKEIGIIYNISQMNVSDIINGKSWKQLIGV